MREKHPIWSREFLINVMFSMFWIGFVLGVLACHYLIDK